MGSSRYQIILIIFLVLSCVAPVWAKKPYKIYVINRYGAWDIVCDSYTVQKDDHVWDILRRKGCIAEDDFPRFVSILKDLNPHIKDVDKIYPSQEILVPLKQIEAKSSPAIAAGPRYITIPMIPDVLYKTRTVHPGECLSKIVTACIGVQWHEIPGEYFKTLRRLNPRIKDMDLIYPDQMIRIPELGPAEWSIAEPGPTAITEEIPPPTTAREEVEGGVASQEPPAERRIPEWRELVSRTATKIGAKLMASGQCHFPGKGQGNITLDLDAFPVIELSDGRHLLLQTGQGLPPDTEEAIRAYWKDLTIISTNAQEAGAVVLEKVFSAMFGQRGQEFLDLPMLDDGIQVALRGDWIFRQHGNLGGAPIYCCITLIEDPEEYTADSVVKYLAEQGVRITDVLTPTKAVKKEAMRGLSEHSSREPPVLAIDGSSHEAFVYKLVEQMGYSYEPSVPLSFDYAGFEIETTVNLIYGKNSLDIVVDFGTFYGEAKSAIETGGLKVLSIKPDDRFLTIARNTLEALEVSFTEDLVLFAATRKVSKTTSVTIPGFLFLQGNDKKALLTQAHIHPRLLDFLEEQQITVMNIKEGAKS